MAEQEDAVEAVVQILAKLCPEAAADAPDEIRYIASMLTDKVSMCLNATAEEETKFSALASAWTNFSVIIDFEDFCLSYINAETESYI